tara:strand:+ start:507 stop:1019 length:513 start_codon:yes stop_codon:yes gene_type:complete
MTPEERAKLFARYESKRKSTSSEGTDSSQGAPPPPSEDTEVEVEEEVEPGFTDFTVAESVSQVPDPVALQQSRQAVAQKVLPFGAGSDEPFLNRPIREIVGEGIDATKEFYKRLGRDKVAELPSEYVDRQIEMLEAQKARLQQQIDDLRGEAARRTGVQEDRLRFQGMEP